LLGLESADLKAGVSGFMLASVEVCSTEDTSEALAREPCMAASASWSMKAL